MNRPDPKISVGSGAISHRSCEAFSLVEVMAAVAVFAIGVVTVLGLSSVLLGPLADMDDEAVAIALGSPLRVELRRLVAEAGTLDPVRVRLGTAGGLAAGDSGEGAARAELSFLAPRSGNFVAAAGDNRWEQTHSSPYFLILLRRNVSLPYGIGAEVPECITYTTEIRWPAFVPTAIGGSPGSGSVSASEQSFIRVHGAVAL